MAQRSVYLQNLAEVFTAFLKLGLTSFGGPVAHIGYFKREFVDKRAWVSHDQFAQLLGISQILPGPASSQLGFTLGLLRAGWGGALAAFVAFTLPSVCILLAFSGALPYLDNPVGTAIIDGLKLVALAVVASAVLGMFGSLCPDTRTRLLAAASAAVIMVSTSALMQVVVVTGAAIIGTLFLRTTAADAGPSPLASPVNRRQGGWLLALFVALLLVLPMAADAGPSLLSIADVFYRAGSMVFGGGHVVLPLLEDSVVMRGWVTTEQFLAGYGAAQAIPGPMFAFSAFLGSVIEPSPTVHGAIAVALLFIFLPGFLLIAGCLPFWQHAASNPRLKNAITGINAAVVGLLGAALYDPVFTSSVSSPGDLAIALVALAILNVLRLSPLLVVAWCVTCTTIPLWLT